MFKKRLLLAFILLCFSQEIQAQSMKITGTVYDSSGLKPLNQSLVMAIRIKDSLLLGFTRTDVNGMFNLNNVPIDTFSLTVMAPHFEARTYYIFGSQQNFEITIPAVQLSTDSKQLQDVIVYANKNPMYYKGDTLVYVADSFKVAENAVVEDLLKKLPGVTVDKTGAITSQGKSISQVLVDGDEFFGSDPTIATKNIAAKGVESVKVYEKKSETASDGEDATIQVMDLRLKENAKKGYFGKASIASDFQKYHEGEILFNKFNGNQKISVFALGSTTPRTNVSRADMNKFGLDNERGNMFNSDGQMQWGNTNSNSAGVPKTFSSGIYYTDKIGKRKQTKIGFNYLYSNYDLTSSTSSRSKYALQNDSSYYSDDSTHSVDLTQTHKINFSVSSQLDSLTLLEIKPKITLSEENLETSNRSNYLDENQVLSRSSIIDNSLKSTGISLDNNLLLLHKFKKPRRQINLNYNISASKGNSTGELAAYNQFYASTGINDTTNQQKTNSSESQTHLGTVTYTEPITKKLKVEFEYLYEYGLTAQNKKTTDGENGIYSIVNLGLTNNFNNLRQQHRLGTSLIMESRTQTISAGLRLRNIDIENQNITTSTTIHQNFTNFLPKFSYLYKPSPSQRINFNYYTKSTQPAISDLQLVQNNTNPNRITLGNPDLKPTYEHSFNLNFNKWQALSGRFIWAGFNSTITNNAFANSTDYDPYGRTISQTVNVNGNLYSSLNAKAGIPLFGKKLDFMPGVHASYSNYSNLINKNTNTTINKAISTELEFAIRRDSFEVEIRGAFNYNDPKNSISTVSTNPYSIQEYSADFWWAMPWKLKIASDATYTINGQRANGYNINFLVWNASISRTFTKTDNLILTLSGNDILNQNISALRTVNGNITTDNKTKIISRYFLLKLVYKFNNNKTKEEDAKMWH